MSPLTYTLITSEIPDRLTKRYDLAGDGKSLIKTPGGSVWRGTFTRTSAAGLEDLARQLEALRPDQAVTWGVPAEQEGVVVARDHPSPPPGAITRTAVRFRFPDGPGVMMLDHDEVDPSMVGLTPESLRKLLFFACPALQGAPMLIRPSSSAGISTDNGREMIPLHRWRIYVPVTRTADIPAAGERLGLLLRAAGLAWTRPAKNGRPLDRTLLDESVWSPERLDFAVPADLGPGLQRESVAPEFHGDPAGLFDLSKIVVTDEQAQLAAKARADGRQRAQAALDAAKAAYVKDHAPRIAHRLRKPVAEVEQELATAADRGELPGWYVLTLADGSETTVDAMCLEPEKYNGVRMYDPVEPEYGSGDKRIAVASLIGSQPTIYSHAHGGTTYVLDSPAWGPAMAAIIFAGSPVSEALPLPAPPLPPLPPPPPPITSANLIRQIRLRSAAEVRVVPPIVWRVKGVLPATGLAVIFGPPGSGKSFLALDAAIAIAQGNERWFGHRVKSAPVVYAALEGQAGFGNRVRAWESHHERVLPERLQMILEPLDLTNAMDITSLSSVLPTESVLFVDTLNRAAPGRDENSPVDMGLILQGAGDIQRATGGLVVVVHHTGKDPTKGARGHSSLHGAADAEIEIERSRDQRSWKITKQKDGEECGPQAFQLEHVSLGLDADGDPVGSLVVAQAGPIHAPTRSLPASARAALQTLLRACGDTGTEPGEGVHLDEWRKVFYSQCTADSDDGKRQAFHRARKTLVDEGLASVRDDFYRPAAFEALRAPAPVRADGDMRDTA